MFRLIKKIFIGSLTGLVNGSNHTNTGCPQKNFTCF